MFHSTKRQNPEESNEPSETQIEPKPGSRQPVKPESVGNCPRIAKIHHHNIWLKIRLGLSSIVRYVRGALLLPFLQRHRLQKSHKTISKRGGILFFVEKKLFLVTTKNDTRNLLKFRPTGCGSLNRATGRFYFGSGRATEMSRTTHLLPCSVFFYPAQPSFTRLLAGFSFFNPVFPFHPGAPVFHWEDIKLLRILKEPCIVVGRESIFTGSIGLKRRVYGNCFPRLLILSASF